MAAAGADPIDRPILFLCKTCKLPLADSGDCVGKDERLIRVTAVTENVEINEEKAVSTYELDDFRCVFYSVPVLGHVYGPCQSQSYMADEVEKRHGSDLAILCTVQVLYCKGCTSAIGTFFVATPLHLDHMLDLFVLSAPTITCYCFDTAFKQRIRLYQKSADMRNVPYLESQLKKV
ncbi:hypothetical protein PRIEUP_LOCUS1593, partial [Pristimantis euphronides]